VEDGVTALRLGGAAAALVLAALALLLARDVRAWNDGLARGDRTYADTPRSATWEASTSLSGDPARRLVGIDDDLALRRAVRAFAVAEATGRGFDNGVSRATARSAAEGALADVAATGSPRQASQANDLLGVLLAGGGRFAVSGPEDRQRAAFEAAVRADPTNADAKYNLELLLRRDRPTGTREGPGRGSGSRGGGRRGAGSGTPGRGY
jgi:hypothetical protein